ncbi:MAG: hydroxyacid dehydrogenase [Micromonosporaceae bacterium]|nr:hydroxyacid dehydrogenase [Micromonosporaceae bacterium]
MTRPVTTFAMDPGLERRLFTPDTLLRLREVAIIDEHVVLNDFTTPAARTALAATEVLLTGWACPPVDDVVLDAAPNLRAIVHAAGTVKAHVTPACWRRGLAVSSAASANALPVAEFTLAAIILAGKNVREYKRLYRARRGPITLLDEFPRTGNYGRRIGIVGASRIGRRLIELLRPLDFDVWVADPFLSEEEATRLGVRATDLPSLLAGCDIVTVHAPALPTTRHLINREGLALLPDGATLINTARGSVVDQDALIAELTTSRINAVIDVTEPEVLPPDCPLYTLPNVLLTPHIAGSLGVELYRFGACSVAELERYAAGLPFAHPVALDDLDRIA